MGEGESRQIPKEFFCPITKEIMTDPVVAADGFTYERSAILEWLEGGNTRSPMTNEELEHALLMPNVTLRNMIRESSSRLPEPTERHESEEGSAEDPVIAEQTDGDMALALRLQQEEMEAVFVAQEEAIYDEGQRDAAQPVLGWKTLAGGSTGSSVFEMFKRQQTEERRDPDSAGQHRGMFQRG